MAANDVQLLYEFVPKQLSKKICIGRRAILFSKDGEHDFLFNRTATIQTTDVVSEGMDKRISLQLVKEVYCVI